MCVSSKRQASVGSKAGIEFRPMLERVNGQLSEAGKKIRTMAGSKCLAWKGMCLDEVPLSCVQCERAQA